MIFTFAVIIVFSDSASCGTETILTKVLVHSFAAQKKRPKMWQVMCCLSKRSLITQQWNVAEENFIIFQCRSEFSPLLPAWPCLPPRAHAHSQQFYGPQRKNPIVDVWLCWLNAAQTLVQNHNVHDLSIFVGTRLVFQGWIFCHVTPLVQAFSRKK